MSVFSHKVRLLILALVLPCATLAAASAPVTDTMPDSTTLRSRMIEAAGSLPDDCVMTTTWHSSDGISGSDVEYRRAGDVRIVSHGGRFTTQRGAVNGGRWHQNVNGITVLEAPVPVPDAVERTTTTLTHEMQPADVYVISRLDDGGYGFREYVDPKTDLIVRTLQHTANGDVTTDFDDFRRFGTAMLAAHWVVKSELLRTTTEYSRTSFQQKRPEDADIAIPPNRRQLVAFPPNAPSVVLPARFVYDGHVVVRLTIDKHGYDFVLDSGASGITVDPAVAAANGLSSYGSFSQVMAGRYQTSLTIIPQLRIGALTMHDVVATIVPQPPINGHGMTTSGLLGFDFLATLGVTIDYAHQRVSVVPAHAYAPPAGRPLYTLDVRLGTQTPETTAFINGARADRLMIDTGGAGSIILFDYFARRHSSALANPAPGSLNVDLPLNGIGGRFSAQISTIKDLRIGNIDISNVAGLRVESRSSYDRPQDGLLGPDFLRQFTVGIDLADARVDLVPTAPGTITSVGR